MNKAVEDCKVVDAPRIGNKKIKVGFIEKDGFIREIYTRLLVG